MWRVDYGDEENHVIPENDLREHEHSIDCWCAPVRDEEDELLVIHNSMDRRELYETGTLKPA